MTETERVNIKSKKLVFHDSFTTALKDLAQETMASDAKFTPSGEENHSVGNRIIEMAYHHSLRSYKGRLFLLVSFDSVINTFPKPSRAKHFTVP